MKNNLFILLFIYLLSCITLYGQSIDTLYVNIEKVNPDTASIKNLLRMAAKASDTAYQKKIDYSQKALALSEQIGFKEGIARAYRRLSMVYFVLGDYTQSLEESYKALQLAAEVPELEFKTSLLQQVGKIYQIQQNLSKAEQYYLQSFTINQQNNKEKSLAYDYSNLANLEIIKKNFEKSLTYRKEEIKLKEKLKDTIGLAFTYNDIYYGYAQQDKANEGIIYLEKAVTILQKLPTDYYKVALNLNLAEVYATTNKIKEAEKIALQGLEDTKKIQAKNLAILATGILYQIYQEKKNYPQAFTYLLFHKKLQDSVYNEQRLKEISRLETNFQVKQKQKENELLRRENNIKNEEIALKNTEAATNRILVGVSLCSIVLLLGILFVFYRNIRIKKKSNDLLTQKNKEIQEQKEEIETIAQNLRLSHEIVQAKNKVIETKNQDILASIQYAKQIQSAILPFEEKIAMDLGKDNFFIFFKPRDIVSGDFYFYEKVENHSIIAVADCTGHGVPGAFMSMIGTQIMTEITLKNREIAPEKILDLLHQEIRRTLQQSQNTKSLDGMDIALLSIQQKDTHTEIAYAGAMNSLYYVQNDEIKEIKADKKAIGGQHYPNETQRLFTKHTLVLPKENKENTVFYLATDGFADQFGGQEKRKFMTKRLRELLLQIAKKPMQTQKKILETTIIDWTTVANEKQTDDITILGIRL